VTGGNMEPLSARMDFEFDPLPEGFGPRVEQLVNDELAADRPIEVSFLPRSTAVMDEDLIRTKVSMIPESVPEIRVVDIDGRGRTYPRDEDREQGQRQQEDPLGDHRRVIRLAFGYGLPSARTSCVSE